MSAPIDMRGREAWQSAFKLLMSRHEDEFKRLYRSERLLRGLPADPKDAAESTEALLAKLDRVREREAKYLARLAARGVTSNGDQAVAPQDSQVPA